LRILYFSRDYTSHDRRFLEALSECGHSVSFLRLQKSLIAHERRTLPPSVVEITWNAHKNVIDTPESCLALMPEFIGILDTMRPDIVHAGPLQSCGFIAALSGFHPLVTMSWGSDVLVDAERDALSRWVTRYAVERADRFICDCDAVREKVRQLAKYPNEQVVQFPWGVDLSTFSDKPSMLQIRNQLGWSDAFIVLSTRSWETIYNIDVLLRGFAKAYSKNARLRLILLGGGSLEHLVGNIIEAEGLHGVVLRPGPVSQTDIAEYFRLADLYVSCTASDGSSISLLEAMATALPVIVTDAPGNREWVVPDLNGWLVANGDSDGLAERLLFAAHLDMSTRKLIGERNRNLVEERADWGVNVRKLLVAYDELVTLTTKP
jgi:glycosyltransferase involved in cell wall biosynthesis